MIFDLIHEQSSLGFTGKLNFLQKETSQFKGCVFMMEGQLVGASYSGFRGRKALVMSLCSFILDDDLKCIVEPEVVTSKDQSFNYRVGDVERYVNELTENIETIRGLRPSADLIFSVIPQFLEKAEEMSQHEYRTLCSIAKFPRVRDLFKHSDEYELELIYNLINLRKKGAIRVSRTI